MLSPFSLMKKNKIHKTYLVTYRSKLVQRPFYERWKMLEKEVIEPRNYEHQNIYQSRNPYYRYDLEPFRVCIEEQQCLIY